MNDSTSPAPQNENGANIVAPETTEAQSQWYWGKDVPGAGDKPDFLKEKFGTVSDQAKAYPELESKLGGFSGAPEQYDIKSIEEKLGVEFESEGERFNGFVEMCKKSNVNQEFLGEILNLYVEEKKLGLPPSIEDVTKQLGDNGSEVMGRLDTWAKNVLSEGEIKTLSALYTSPEVVKIFDKIRGSQGHNNNIAPPTNAAAGLAGRSVSEIKGDMSKNFESGKPDELLSQKLRDELRVALRNNS